MTEPPSGTFTFLLTDIEGSTVLARRLGEQYGEVLSEHFRLLRTAFEEAGGQGISMQGDAVFVAFRRPKNAILAALTGQRALARQQWPLGVPPRVRMGIHTGEASVVGDQYHGVAIHRAARICAAGHGGQILVSHATAALLEDEQDDESLFTLRDLGQQRLKDFERGVRIYQLIAPDLPQAFPTIRTVEATLAEREHEQSETADEGTIRILLVDDQALLRTGFRMIIDSEEGMEVVGEAANGHEALAEASRLKPDVVLMDVRMPELDGIEATRLLLRHETAHTRVVMLTTFDMDEYVYEAFRAGASGFLLKDVPPEQLVVGIRAVASGDALLAPAVTRRVIEEYVSRPPNCPRTLPTALEQLTPREVDVLKLIARGLSNAEIAEVLVLSETTVKTHVAHLLMKLDLRDRVQAVVLAYESGLVETGETAQASKAPPAP
jgi:DNA-binding NarL/FixJ family response regulator/class 3 adenylate cyclase